ncbi:MAG: DNA repair protein RadA [Oscillospiraceae bacterium]|nr:DNA repair protein RadA [Oscillospiraceae bacterium]
MKGNIFFCTQCGNESSKWQGQCPACKAWNTMDEAPTAPANKAKKGTSRVSSHAAGERPKPQKLNEISTADEIRFSTGMDEFDRALGGGAVAGSLVLLGGEPGIGKSTLLLQICHHLCRDKTVLYISGEESLRQLKLRAARLGIDTPNLLVMAETCLDNALEEAMQADILIVDSIQTMQRADSSSAPGSVSQVKDCTLALMAIAKQTGLTVFVVGHVNKDGQIAGPKVLEHMVDCVLSFEGDRHVSHRIVRAVKNRFGPTNEVAVFDMGQQGLVEVPNPSEMLLAGRPLRTPGCCVACVMEGSRPLMAEIQALVTPTPYGTPRRMTAGVDYNRAILLMAVLEKRAGVRIGDCDAYVNVVGGLDIDEPAADLPIVLALASSVRDTTLGDNVAAVGEVGLAGELRMVNNLSMRLNEIARLGFSQCIVPWNGTAALIPPEGLQIVRVKSVAQAVGLLG